MVVQWKCLTALHCLYYSSETIAAEEVHALTCLQFVVAEIRNSFTDPNTLCERNE